MDEQETATEQLADRVLQGGDKAEVAECLRQVMTELGVDAPQFAILVGIGEDTLNRWLDPQARGMHGTPHYTKRRKIRELLLRSEEVVEAFSPHRPTTEEETFNPAHLQAILSSTTPYKRYLRLLVDVERLLNVSMSVELCKLILQEIEAKS